MKFYVIQRGRRYWTGFVWVTFSAIHKAMFFSVKEEARCAGADALGKIIEIYISLEPLSLPNTVGKDFRVKTDALGVTTVKGPSPTQGRKVTERAIHTSPKKKGVNRRTLNNRLKRK